MLRLAVGAALLAAAGAWVPTPSNPDDPHVVTNPKVLVVYASDQYNVIQSIANAVAEGAQSQKALTKVVEVSSANYKRDVLEWADAVVLGSGTFNGNAAPRMLSFINSFDFLDPLGTKVGAAFATGGGPAAGLENVLTSLNKGLKTFGMVTTGGRVWRNVDGVGAVTTGDSTLDHANQTMELARDEGSRIAQMAKTMKRTSVVAGDVDAPIYGVRRVLDSMTWTMGKVAYSVETRLNATCESYCRGWMAAAGCTTCLPIAFSFPGADAVCVHPGPTGTGLLCRVDPVTKEVTGQSCCGDAGPCQLPVPGQPGLDMTGDWPGACCNEVKLPHGGGDCSKCAGGSPKSEIFPLLNDSRTVPSNRRWFNYATSTCMLGVQPSS